MYKIPVTSKDNSIFETYIYKKDKIEKSKIKIEKIVACYLKTKKKKIVFSYISILYENLEKK